MEITIPRSPNLKSKGLLPSDACVWLPPQYHQNPEAHFPAIDMQDGQNLFYPERSYTNITWGVAETISKLSQWGFIRSVIVVGIDNTTNRRGDYPPTQPFEIAEGKGFVERLQKTLPKVYQRVKFVSDQYVQLMVEIIKPRNDQDFRTSTKREDTIVLGSSMGGLISLYVLIQRPLTFGAAGYLSTHWPTMGDFSIPYLQRNLPAAGKHRIYYDHGTHGLDVGYPHYQHAVDEVMRKKGYVQGKDWLTRFAPGVDHHERAWHSRLHIALRFLLGT